MVAFFKSAFALQYVLWDDPFQVVTHLSVKKKKTELEICEVLRHYLQGYLGVTTLLCTFEKV